MATNSLQAESVSANPPVSWHATVAAWRDAVVAYGAHPYCSACPGAPDYGALERDAEGLQDAEVRALEAVMNMPAPDHAALVEKLEIIKAEFGNDNHCIDRVIADVRRLGSL